MNESYKDAIPEGYTHVHTLSFGFDRKMRCYDQEVFKKLLEFCDTDTYRIVFSIGGDKESLRGCFTVLQYCEEGLG